MRGMQKLKHHSLPISHHCFLVLQVADLDVFSDYLMLDDGEAMLSELSIQLGIREFGISVYRCSKLILLTFDFLVGLLE